MKRRTQNTLYHLLPVVFWLLAAGVALAPVIIQITSDKSQITNNYYWGFLVAPVAFLCILIIGRIQRHTNSVGECFQVALLLGIVSYWLPTVLFLILPIWFYLISRNLFSFRSFMSTLIGLGTVALWDALLVWLGWIGNPWFDFFAKENAWGWIPTGALLIAWLASSIARRALRVR